VAWSFDHLFPSSVPPVPADAGTPVLFARRSRARAAAGQQHGKEGCHPLRAISLKASAMDRAAQSREGWSHEAVRSPGMAPHPALLQALHHKVAAAIGSKRILRRDNLGIFLPEFFETLQKNLFLSRSRRRNRAGQPRRNPFRKNSCSSTLRARVWSHAR
jgi:hypothetical protein